MSGANVKYSYVVWDWNGTLFEDMSACIRAMNKLLKQKGLESISGIDEYRSKFCFPVKKYYERLEFNFDIDPFENLAHIYIENYSDERKTATLFHGATDVLEQLNRSGVKQCVVSASEQNSLVDQMNPFGISHYFIEVMGIDNHYATSKVDLAKRWILKSNVDLSEIVFIGDSVHDFEVAAAVGCPCILIANGHQGIDELKTTSATVVGNITEIVDLIL